MRHLRPLLISATALAACLMLAAPAFAHDPQQSLPPPMIDGASGVHDLRPEWRGPQPGSGTHQIDHAAYDRARADWLAVCRHNQRHDAGQNDGLGGGVIGGLLGGLLGNRIAGHGNRVVGTVVGAVAGAAAGAALDKAGNRSRERDLDRDYCETYLDSYTQQGSGGYYQQGYVQPVMMVPMMMVQAQQAAQQPCTETIVTEEWVAVPARHHTIIRYIPPRPAPDKRVRIVPDKRIRSQ